MNVNGSMGVDTILDSGVERGGTPEPESADGAPWAAIRLLEVAASNADKLVDDAKAEAERLTSSARTEAAGLLAEARDEAARVRIELNEVRVQRYDEITRLRMVEQQHRDRMRDHLNEVLARIEPVAS
jgi:cell division septum initiation protein DivIVA